MAGCGYVCPQCEGKSFLEDGSKCDYCNNDEDVVNPLASITSAEWLQEVHEGKCCSE